MPALVSPRKSTIVRASLTMRLLRLRMRLGSWLAPNTTIRFADRLFGTPMASSRRRAEQAGLADAEFEFLPWRGERLAVYRWGDPARQPTVLFAHGWSSFGLRCLPWVAPLREAGYAVVSFDQIGHGRSSGRRNHLPGFAAALTAVASHLDGGKSTTNSTGSPSRLAAVIGHSLGGAASMLALTEGLRAQRAILIAPPADMAAATQRFARFVGLAEHLVRPLVSYFEHEVGQPVDGLRANLRVPGIATPGLIVHDCGDREVPWDEGERYARHWPTARLLSTTGLGHHRVFTDEQVIAAGLRFLAGDSVGERVVSSPNLPYGIA